MLMWELAIPRAGERLKNETANSERGQDRCLFQEKTIVT